jgi:hypothetical protein
MARRDIQAGDYFLLPYAGPRRKRIVKAIQPHPVGAGQWYVADEAGHTSTVLLTSCSRVSPSEVERITNPKSWNKPHTSGVSAPSAEAQHQRNGGAK